MIRPVLKNRFESTRELAIVGTGDFAREVADIALLLGWRQSEIYFIGGSEAEVGKVVYGEMKCKCTDDAYLNQLRTVTYPDQYWVIGIGEPSLRRTIARKYERKLEGKTRPLTLVHPTALSGLEVEIGEGCIVAANCVLTNRIRVGKHCVVNLACTIGHDCIVGNYCNLSPGVHLNGHTTLEEAVSVGSGVVTVPGASVGSDSVIGAGAVIKGSIEAGVVAVGVPAKAIRRL